MSRYHYQVSAYGNPWETSKQGETLGALSYVRDDFWLKMLAERHHRIIDTEDGDKVVWFHKSKIAPPPGSKEQETT